MEQIGGPVFAAFTDGYFEERRPEVIEYEGLRWYCETNGCALIMRAMEDPVTAEPTFAKEIFPRLLKSGWPKTPRSIEAERSFLARHVGDERPCTKCNASGEVACHECSGTGDKTRPCVDCGHEHVCRCSRCVDCGHEHVCRCSRCDGGTLKCKSCDGKGKTSPKFVRMFGKLFNLLAFAKLFELVVPADVARVHIEPGLQEHVRFAGDGWIFVLMPVREDPHDGDRTVHFDAEDAA